MSFNELYDGHQADYVESDEDHFVEESGHEDWGRNVRLAIEMMDNSHKFGLNFQSTSTVKVHGQHVGQPKDAFGSASETKADGPNNVETPNDIESILNALYSLANQENVNLCTQIELLVRFDDLKGWQEFGAKNCAAWMNAHLQIDRRIAWERLRVGRKIRDLPVIHRLFHLGRLSWSKVRLLTRIANPDNEKILAHASMDATVTDVQRICDEYRWNDTTDEVNDAIRANLQWERRRLTWHRQADGNTQIRIVLPPERAQNILHAIESCEEILYEENAAEKNYQDINGESAVSIENSVREDSVKEDSVKEERVTEDNARSQITPSQRRADAVVLLAERSMSFLGNHIAPADRYQVVLNIDTDSLSYGCNESKATGSGLSRNPLIEGMGPVPIASARQIACDCSIIKLLTEQGEPLSIGRKHRVWPAAMRRAILTRDRHCQFPDCDSHKFLQIHHIHHWADGGSTSVDNGVCLCQHHHQLIHSGKYSIERAVVGNAVDEVQGLFSSSKKQLLPTRCRFVVKRIDSKLAAANATQCTEPTREYKSMESDNRAGQAVRSRTNELQTNDQYPHYKSHEAHERQRYTTKQNTLSSTKNHDGRSYRGPNHA